MKKMPSVHLALFLFMAIVASQLAFSRLHASGDTVYWLILANQLLVIFLPAFIIALAMKFDMGALYPLRPPPATLIIKTIGLTLAATVVIDYLQFASEIFIPPPKELEEHLKTILAISSQKEMFFKIGLICLLPAFCEELLFRGFCQTTFAAKLGTPAAILLSAVIFAIAHGNPWHIHLYLLLGIFLGWLYAVTGTLWIPITAHFVNNLRILANYSAGTKIPIPGASFMLNAMILALAVLLFVYFAISLRAHRTS